MLAVAGVEQLQQSSRELLERDTEDHSCERVRYKSNQRQILRGWRGPENEEQLSVLRYRFLGTGQGAFFAALVWPLTPPQSLLRRLQVL